MPRSLRVIALAAVALLALAPAQAARAQVANQVTGLTATQHDGYVTLAWTPVAGATDYQIERTPVDAANVPTGASVVTGVWQPQRTITPDRPRFADAGFALGGRYQWRVRARFGTTSPQPYSDPVFGTTNPQWGTGPGASMRTQWELSGNATYTSDVNEYAYEAALVAASPRVRMVELGRTNPVASGPAAPGDRPINMLIIGGTPALTPLPTAAAISGSPTIAYNCNVHGNEPQGRESCLIFARMLAFTDDPHLLEILRATTVLLVPAINGNGRAANTRGNETGADLNRDHAGIEQPETKAFAAMLRDYTPEVGVDLHEGDNEDLPILTARHLNVYEPLFEEGKLGLVEGWLYQHASDNGWWHGPYSSGGDSHEGILRNTFALKNAVGLLAENRAAGGTTRPAEGTNLANRNRKSYGSLYEEFTMLDYYWERRATIHSLVEQSIAFNKSNAGRAVTRGSYPWPYNPLNGANTGLPDVDAVTADHIIDPPPCGYFLTEEQYSGPRAEGTVGLRLGIHGIAQETRPAGHIVRMAQALRGLIPTILDPADVSPEPIVAALRLFECPHVVAAPRSFAGSLPEGGENTRTLRIRNVAPEADEPLTWTITEAVSDCSSPSDLTWVSASPLSGTTPSAGGSDDVAVTISAAGLSGHSMYTGVLCLSSNDAGEGTIAIPLRLNVRS
jgi:Zinc carboxypeptidase